MEWKELRAALRGLTIYQEALETEIGQTVTGLLDALYRQDGEGALAAYTGLFAALCRAEFQGLGDWLWDRLRPPTRRTRRWSRALRNLRAPAPTEAAG